jgi:hypothetical protein
MRPADESVQDVMQVCRNGHVITDRLRASPESGRAHCDRCGAATLEGCPTCGRGLPGAIAVPGLQPVGSRPPPRYCEACGAAFPWAERPGVPAAGALAQLEATLGRLPRVIRQLRVRQGDRPAFRVVDEKDLEDLLRAVLSLHSDDVRPEGRAPGYAAGTRTDFVLAPEQVAVTAKVASPAVREPQLAVQLREDGAYYGQPGKCRTLVAFVYDPEGLVRDVPLLTAACRAADEVEVRLVIGGP